MSSNCDHCLKLLDVCNTLSSKVDQMMQLIIKIASNSDVNVVSKSHSKSLELLTTLTQPSQALPTFSSVVQTTSQPSPRLTRSQTTAAGASSITKEAPAKPNAKPKKVKKNKVIDQVKQADTIAKCSSEPILDLVGCGPSIPDIKIAEPRKMLYISNLDPHTGVEQISTFISSKFGVEPILCTKLVPGDRNLETLGYVSFKVLVPENVFGNFLDSKSWPSGVIVREFVHRTKNLKRTVARI